MQADGIEANYIYINRSNNDEKINDTKKWRNFAKKNNLFTTIGSDFHYADGIAPLIGLVSENLDLDDNYFEEVLKNLNN